MERRDLLTKHIEVLGEALRKLISKVSLLKEKEATDTELAEIDDLLRAEIGMDLNDLAKLTNEAFLKSLMGKKLEAADLSTMINLLVELAKVNRTSSDKYDSNQLLSKAVFIGDYLSINQKTVYFGNVSSLDTSSRGIKGKE
jgi:hypothetical protein